MKTDEQKIIGPEAGPENLPKTTDEKAQYEVFRNGTIPRETIDKWIRNDLAAVQSFVHGILTDESIFRALADAYYARYQALHQKKENDDQPN